MPVAGEAARADRAPAPILLRRRARPVRLPVLTFRSTGAP